MKSDNKDKSLFKAHLMRLGINNLNEETKTLIIAAFYTYITSLNLTVDFDEFTESLHQSIKDDDVLLARSREIDE